MKRSDMLSKIASVIINYNEVTCIINHDKAMEMAETILRVQEKASMLPPKACLEWSVRVGDEERTVYHNTNEWEPEDE